MKIYCALPFGEDIAIQEHFHTTRPPSFLPAHMVYRIRGTRLYLASGVSNIRGGVMVVSTSSYAGGGPFTVLMDDITDEIEKRGFEGVVLDNGGETSSAHTALAARIVAALSPLPVFLPEQMASVVGGSVALIQTALSGGSLERHLVSAAEQYGVGNVAVECDRVRMDFILPAASGTGKNLSASELEGLLEKSGGQFYSKDLYVNYFTYTDGGARHMVLFDNGESMKRKLTFASHLGIARAFLFYPNTYDIVSELGVF